MKGKVINTVEELLGHAEPNIQRRKTKAQNRAFLKEKAFIEDFVNNHKNKTTEKGYSQKQKEEIEKQFVKYLGEPELQHFKSLKEFFLNKDAVTKHLENLKGKKGEPIKQESKKKRLGNISSYLKFYNESNEEGHTIYSKTIKELNEEIDENRVNRVVDGNIEELKKLTNHIDESDYRSLEAKIVLSLYLNYPPKRSDISTVKIRNIQDGDNYYDFDTQSIVYKILKKNKNADIVKLKKEHHDLICKLKDAHTGDYLIVNTINQAYTGTMFSNWLYKITQRYLNKKMNIRDFRGLWATTVEENAKTKKEKVKVKRQTAKDMNTSVKMLDNHYIFEKPEAEPDLADKIAEALINKVTQAAGNFLREFFKNA
jgi:hypothetical protein